MLRSVSVPKCLDKRLKILGFEVLDLLAIFILLSFLHLFLGDLGNQFLFVWCPSLTFTLILWFGKRGKPENHLIHWIRYHLKPGRISAFDRPTKYIPYDGRQKSGWILQ